MPRIAKAVLIDRIYRTGLFDQLQADVRILFRKRLWFLPHPESAPESSVHVELIVGAVHVGTLGFKASAKAERNAAYRRWLEMAARIFAEELSAPQDHSVGAIPSKIAKAARLIQARHRDQLSLANIAQSVDLSRERLSRLFHQSLGLTFSEYLSQTRLATARKLLTESELPITQIAYESGFQSLSQFNRRFKSSERESPSTFRKRARSLQTSPRTLP
ncbi:helix-turn-helix domain-containing protein [Coraliomargarita akajimensis]|uniref:Transcriptional regulator, AraC family n=1 Tax=Coraliomargarita akajimensis (strain DSM 45221 / IAM 15411 / JCM 23193 / KCTC 12865 / 04OKA010-24) TaxID=583355 RepID=D5EKR1_CORAD|nr:AraC family transcriptional regulator [Coraliomargarita akajimensis]ADE54968.1 transcriptional regulator, AraC family [Coraliomargarita akajimensis DSM 45221]